MRSLSSRAWRRAFPGALVPCALLAAACGSANHDALEKRVASLQEEVTRLQNVNDRLAERVQALEIAAMRDAKPAGGAAPSTGSGAAVGEDRVARPPLKVVKLAPGGTQEPGEPEPAETPPVDDKGPRPVIRDHGAKAAPVWGRPAPRAGRPPVGQNAGDTRPAPQGT